MVMYTTIAGRSNALGGLVDATVTAPVITCPPYSEAFGGSDVFSSLRMPGGVAPLLILEPANAALAAAKILGLSDPRLADLVRQGGERPLNIARQQDELVRLVLRDPTGVWAHKAPRIEVVLEIN